MEWMKPFHSQSTIDQITNGTPAGHSLNIRMLHYNLNHASRWGAILLTKIFPIAPFEGQHLRIAFGDHLRHFDFHKFSRIFGLHLAKFDR